jgi:hypothetical protein
LSLPLSLYVIYIHPVSLNQFFFILVSAKKNEMNCHAKKIKILLLLHVNVDKKICSI